MYSENAVSILTSTKMRIISITSLETLFKFPYAAMFPWVLIAIIKLHLACVPIYMPGTTYNTISFLPLRVFLLSFPPLYNFHSPAFTELDLSRGLQEYWNTDEKSHYPTCSNSRGRQRAGIQSPASCLPRILRWVLHRDLFLEYLVDEWINGQMDG